MNSLLNLITAKLAYDKGKETGLAGLIGIIFVIVVGIEWGHIKPILKYSGGIGFLNRHGLIYHGSPGLTWLRMVGAFLGVYAVVIVIFLMLMVVLFLFSTFASTKVGGWIEFLFGMALMCVFISPFLLIAAITKGPILLSRVIKAILLYLIDPMKYKEDRKERKRLND